MAWFEAVGNKLLAHNVVADETWQRHFETKNKSTTDGVASCEFHLEEEVHSCHFFMRVAWVYSFGHHAYKNRSQFKSMRGEINKASFTFSLVRTLGRWLKFCVPAWQFPSARQSAKYRSRHKIGLDCVATPNFTVIICQLQTTIFLANWRTTFVAPCPKMVAVAKTCLNNTSPEFLTCGCTSTCSKVAKDSWDLRRLSGKIGFCS